MAQFKATADKKYYNSTTGQEVSFTQDQLNDPATGFLSDQFQEGSAPSRYTGGGSDYDTEYSKYLKDLSNPVDENAIREQRMRDAQASIDQINLRFDNIIKEEKRLGEGYMGQTRSAAARGGLIGSDFGSSQLNETSRRNQQVIDMRNAERAAEISAVMDKVNERADAEIKSKTEMALKGREAYLGYLKANRDEARTDLINLAKTGSLKSLEELSNEDYDKLIKQTGYDEATAKLTFNANLPAAQKIDYQFKIEGNKLFAYGIDPATGNISFLEKQLGDPIPPDYKPTVLPDGTLIFTPSKIDPNKPLKDQVLMYGAEGQFSKPKSSSGDGTPSDTATLKVAKAQVSQYFADRIGEDMKVSNETWNQMKRAWIEDDYLAGDFDKFFEAYKNPDNPLYN